MLDVPAPAFGPLLAIAGASARTPMQAATIVAAANRFSIPSSSPTLGWGPPRPPGVRALPQTGYRLAPHRNLNELGSRRRDDADGQPWFHGVIQPVSWGGDDWSDLRRGRGSGPAHLR